MLVRYRHCQELGRGLFPIEPVNIPYLFAFSRHGACHKVPSSSPSPSSYHPPEARSWPRDLRLMEVDAWVVLMDGDWEVGCSARRTGRSRLSVEGGMDLETWKRRPEHTREVKEVGWGGPTYPCAVPGGRTGGESGGGGARWTLPLLVRALSIHIPSWTNGTYPMEGTRHPFQLEPIEM